MTRSATAVTALSLSDVRPRRFACRFACRSVESESEEGIIRQYTNHFYDENGVDLGFCLGMSWDATSDIIDFVQWKKAAFSKSHTKQEFKALARIKSNKVAFVTFKSPLIPATPKKL